MVEPSAFSFDDIEFWVGNGANRAALVIDWVENAADPPALAWGYRWDGAAKGRDMLTALVAADPRLFAKLGGTPGSPVAVYGLGYDADGDGLWLRQTSTTSNVQIVAPQPGVALFGATFTPDATSIDFVRQAAGGPWEVWRVPFWAARRSCSSATCPLPSRGHLTASAWRFCEPRSRRRFRLS